MRTTRHEVPSWGGVGALFRMLKTLQKGFSKFAICPDFVHQISMYSDKFWTKCSGVLKKMYYYFDFCTLRTCVLCVVNAMPIVLCNYLTTNLHEPEMQINRFNTENVTHRPVRGSNPRKGKMWFKGHFQINGRKSVCKKG